MRCIFSRFLIHIHPVIAKEGRQYRLYLRNLALLQLRYWTSGNFSFLFPQGIGLEEVNLLVCHCYRKKPIIDVILQCRFSRKHLMSVITQWKLALEKKKALSKQIYQIYFHPQQVVPKIPTFSWSPFFCLGSCLRSSFVLVVGAVTQQTFQSRII